ncbi:MAG: hypothetical protein QOE83_1143 [Actinomycetota bacterium]|nr:hypothetical protein [Actinomycetota bacterium]
MYRWIRIAALSALVPLVAAAACSSNSSTTTPQATASSASDGMGSMSSAAAMTADISTGASSLRATLSTLLQSHVYLAGIATGAALQDGPTSSSFKAAAATLDLNSQDLAAAVGSVYGDAAGKTFLALWRKHIGFFVDYTVGLATKDKAMETKALKDLDGYRADFGAFIESATGGILSKDAVATELKMHVETLAAAIAAQAAGSPKAFALLRTAASHMPMTADVLATAFTQQFPDKFPGSTEDPAAALRTGLEDLLQEHVYLAGIATGTALHDGATSPAYKAAAATLDLNSQDLAAAVGSVYGDAAGKTFLALWRKHIGFFVDYTLGAAAGDKKMEAAALKDLDGYRADFGAFIESATGGILSKDAVATELKGHIETLSAAIAAQAAGSPKAYGLLREAGNHMPMTADVLAGAFVQQFPDKFVPAGS